LLLRPAFLIVRLTDLTASLLLCELCVVFVRAPSTTDIYPLSLHDALPICPIHHHFEESGWSEWKIVIVFWTVALVATVIPLLIRSEEHTSELQSRFELVCRLLLEKKKAAERPGHESVSITARARRLPR